MSSEPVRLTRRERRAAVSGRKRDEPRRANRRSPRVGIGLISAAGLAAGLLIVAAIVVLGGRPKPVAVSVMSAAAPGGIPTIGFVLGAADAPVTIDLYEDFQCPACLRWGQTVFPSLARNELADGTARVVFHGFAFIGPESADAGRAAWAANRQGRFWDMWATLYANQGPRENGGSFSRARLVAMAETLGLDVARFTTDLSSAAATEYVAEGVADAARAGVSSTPTVVIAGTAIMGGYTDVAAAIRAAAGE